MFKEQGCHWLYEQTDEIIDKLTDTALNAHHNLIQRIKPMVA